MGTCVSHELKQYGDFDVAAFHAALDAERQARGLTWAALARELNRPIAHLPKIHPISASTLSDMTNKKAELLNPHMVMHALRWLGRTPESFVPGHPDSAAKATIPAGVPHGLGRWNFEALRAAVDARRAERDMTWIEVAAEIGFLATTAKKLSKGGSMGLPSIVRVTTWLDRPATDFFVWILQ